MRVFSLAAAAAAVVEALAALLQTQARQVLVLPVFLCFSWSRGAGGVFLRRWHAERRLKV